MTRPDWPAWLDETFDRAQRDLDALPSSAQPVLVQQLPPDGGPPTQEVPVPAWLWAGAELLDDLRRLCPGCDAPGSRAHLDEQGRLHLARRLAQMGWRKS